MRDPLVGIFELPGDLYLGDAPFADGLVPRRDMEPDGFQRNIHANVVFAAWLDRIPDRGLRACGIIRFVFLVS